MKYLTTAEAGEIIGMTPEYVQRQCKKGAIQAKKLGDEWRIHPDALHAFMSDGKPATTDRPDKKLSARQMRRAS